MHNTITANRVTLSTNKKKDQFLKNGLKQRSLFLMPSGLKPYFDVIDRWNNTILELQTLSQITEYIKIQNGVDAFATRLGETFFLS